MLTLLVLVLVCGFLLSAMLRGAGIALAIGLVLLTVCTAGIGLVVVGIGYGIYRIFYRSDEPSQDTLDLNARIAYNNSLAAAQWDAPSPESIVYSP